jgi:hypothetical protein
MFLEKFKNRYSFNFLSICGWIVFILLCIFFFPDILNPEAGLPLAIIFIGILILNIFFYFITLIIYIIESISLKRIINEKILKNKYVNIIRVLGIFFSLLPLIILIIYFVLNSI